MGIKTIVAPIIVWAMIAGFTSPAQDPHSVWDGVYTEQQATRGGGFYTRSCGNCHGANLEGADMSPALTGGAFLSNWDGSTVGDLFERIRVSMPADRPGTLARQEIADIVAFILTSNRFPAGKTELPREAQLLKEIRFARKPPAN
jgi:mono/diheme cytochrome c family protein